MKVISNIRRAIKYLVLSHQLNKASRKADKLQLKTGKTHYVVKGTKGSLLVVTRKSYRNLSKKGKAVKVTADQMYQGCFYCTRWYHKDNPTPYEVIQRKRRIFFAANGL